MGLTVTRRAAARRASQRGGFPFQPGGEGQVAGAAGDGDQAADEELPHLGGAAGLAGDGFAGAADDPGADEEADQGVGDDVDVGVRVDVGLLDGGGQPGRDDVEPLGEGWLSGGRGRVTPVASRSPARSTGSSADMRAMQKVRRISASSDVRPRAPVSRTSRRQVADWSSRMAWARSSLAAKWK